MQKKYAKIKEIYITTNIKTYLESIEPIMKEIKPKNEEDYHTIKELLEILKKHFAAYEILEEEEKFHVLQIIIKN